MKASDLMVGDWVWNEFNKKAEKVSSVMDNLIMLDYNDCYNPEEPIDEIEPIPLTVEILEKNGFDVSDGEVMEFRFTEGSQTYKFFIKQMYDRNGKRHGFSSYAFNVLSIIDYVHELQHAFRICGIPKEIVP